jgi:hypothetical protein
MIFILRPRHTAPGAENTAVKALTDSETRAGWLRSEIAQLESTL